MTLRELGLMQATWYYLTAALYYQRAFYWDSEGETQMAVTSRNFGGMFEQRGGYKAQDAEHAEQNALWSLWVAQA